MALVGFLLALSVSAKSTRRTSFAAPAILNLLTARNAGLCVKPLMDTVRGDQNIARSLVTKLFQILSFFENIHQNL